MSKRNQNEDPLLKINNLSVTFYTQHDIVHAVRDVSLDVRRGKVLGLVGESGCGKSTTAFAVMGYLQGIANVDGSIIFEGKDIVRMSELELRKLRGNRISMVYQNPATSLNPTMRVGRQTEDVLREHLGYESEKAHQRVIELFESVRLAEPDKIGMRYPHELSGGMQQRVMIAMALACEPDMLIMDEPTTSLDVTTEATILDLIADLKQRLNAGILYVTHNLGVIARVADHVAVMYAGQSIEQAPVKELFKNPKHPYTAGLLNCVPQLDTKIGKVNKLRSIAGAVYPANEKNDSCCLFAPRCPLAQDVCYTDAPEITDLGNTHETRCFFRDKVNMGIWGEAESREKDKQETTETVLSASGLRRFFGQWQRKYLFFGPRVRPPVRAVTNIDFSVNTGQTLGIVGESGCGKTTVARTLVGLVAKDRGEILLNSEELAPRVEQRNLEQRSALQMVFQNPASSLNPKLPIRHAIQRSVKKLTKMGGQDSVKRAAELLTAVGLDTSYLDRRPAELSIGEQQRVALAGAFAGNSSVIVADEAVSSLDVSVQAQVLKLLEDHQQEKGTSYIFISHDLAVVRYISNHILVLYAGQVAESGPSECVLHVPSHPYTEALLSAAPVPDPDARTTLIRLPGAVPTMRERFKGCFFAGRCPRKIGAICDQTPPPVQIGPNSQNHMIYCHIPVEELAKLQGGSLPGKD